MHGVVLENADAHALRLLIVQPCCKCLHNQNFGSFTMLHVSVEEAEPGKQVCRMAAAEDMTPDKQRTFQRNHTSQGHSCESSLRVNLDVFDNYRCRSNLHVSCARLLKVSRAKPQT